MGACDFQHYADGIDVKKAFDTATSEAAYEHGHGGYSGTLAEKSNYVVITSTPLLEREAYALADQLMEDDDPRISDKWGPAGAIPVIKGTRKVDVKGFEYVHDHDHRDYSKPQPGLLEAVAPVVKLKKGETIQGIALTTYETPRSSMNVGYGRIATRASKTKYTNCSAVVTINKPPTTRVAPITIEIPGGLDYDAKNKEIERQVRSMRLKVGESIVSWRATRDTPGKAKVTAVAPKGATETRFVIKGTSDHGSWDTGFASQAEARAWATEYMSSDTRNFHTDTGFLEVESVTRRADGQALVRVTREVSKRQVDVEVEVKLAGAKTEGPADGWLFFGWASS